MSPAAAGGGAARVLVLPVLRRYWLLHAWAEASPTPPTPWQDGATAVDKARLLAGELQRRAAGLASRQLAKQWQRLEAAPPGSPNSRLLRLANAVMSRVDPTETALKALPAEGAARFDVIAPASLPARLVRRRLRLLARTAAPFHASRLRLWALAVVPQLPLIPLPLPNVTLYYTFWRLWSNYAAGRGAKALQASLDAASDEQRAALAARLAALRAGGLELRRGSWAEALADEAPALRRRVEQQQQARQQQQAQAGVDGAAPRQQQQQPPPPVLVVVGDARLEALLDPAARRAGLLLPEAAVARVAELFRQPSVTEHYHAALRKLGAAAAAPPPPPEQQPPPPPGEQQQGEKQEEKREAGGQR